MKNTHIKLFMIAVIALVLIAIAAAAFYLNGNKSPLPKAIAIDTHDQPTLGNLQAKLHIVAFEDLKCGNCMQFNETLLKKINQHYIEKGMARYTVINLAFIPGSLPAANAARCIYVQDKNAFFDYVADIYAHQPPEETDWATIPHLMMYATHIPRINLDAFADCLVKSPYTDFIIGNLDLARQVMGPDVSTPTVYVNGVKIDPLTWEQFQRVVRRLE